MGVNSSLAEQLDPQTVSNLLGFVSFAGEPALYQTSLPDDVQYTIFTQQYNYLFTPYWLEKFLIKFGLFKGSSAAVQIRLAISFSSRLYV